LSHKAVLISIPLKGGLDLGQVDLICYLRFRNVEASMRRWEAAFRLGGMGFFIGSSIVLGALGGRWLDSKLNSEPVLVIVGLILGIVVAFYGVYRMILPLTRNK